MLWTLNTSTPPLQFPNPLDALLALRELSAPPQEIFLPSEGTGATFWPLDARRIIRGWASDALVHYVGHTCGYDLADQVQVLVTDLEERPVARMAGGRVPLRRRLLEMLPLMEEEPQDWDPARALDPELREVALRGTAPQRALLAWTFGAITDQDARPHPRAALEVAEIIVRHLEGMDRRGWMSLSDSALWQTLGKELDGRLVVALAAETLRHAGGRPTAAAVAERRAREAAVETVLEGGLFEALGWGDPFAEDEEGH